MAQIKLIAGLGNPGTQYEATRHNVGFWFLNELARSKGAQFKHERKFHGEVAKVNLEGQDIWLIKPLTYMNKSGQAVASLAHFYKIPPESILVVHDELDIATGLIRLKKGGGHGGHNGLRDMITQLGDKGFMRLRLGIDHPGHSSEVSHYVLSKPKPEDARLMEYAIDEVLRQLHLIIPGEMEKAMNHLHSYKP